MTFAGRVGMCSQRSASGIHDPMSSLSEKRCQTPAATLHPRRSHASWSEERRSLTSFRHIESVRCRWTFH